jgi:hypothetical protein
VPRQFVDHPLTIDFVLRGVVQHVETDESTQQVFELHLEQPSSTTEEQRRSVIGLSSATSCDHNSCGEHLGSFSTTTHQA